MSMVLLLTTESVANLMSNLFGKKVAARRTAPLAAEDVKKSVVATYVRDDGAAGALAIADIPLVAYAGAALALIPPGYAREVAGSGQLPENIFENFHEILNIGSRWFNSPRTPHVTLKDVMYKPQAFAQDVGAILRNPGPRLDVEVSIPGYGDGKLTLIAGGPSAAPAPSR
jgi:hypothetical protein